MIEVKKKVGAKIPQPKNAPQPQQDVLQQLFSNQGVVSHQQYPLHIGDGTYQNIYMIVTDINLQTNNKFYRMLDLP